MDFQALVVIMMSAVLVNNFVLRQFLGICPFLGVSKELKSSIGMSSATVFVMIMATVVTWPINRFLLEPSGLDFMQLVLFVLIIAAFVQITEFTMKKYMPALYNSLGVYLPLMTTNCAIVAVVILNTNEGLTFLESIVNALGAGAGFFLAMVIFSGIRGHTESSTPPESFKGLPLALISAAILSMAFFGFQGVAENLFT